MENNSSKNTNNNRGAWEIIFWILWVVLFAVLPLYLFTLLFEFGAVKEGDIGSQISPVIGILVIVAQIAIFVISFKQIRKKMTLSKPYLTLLGGSILIGFIWVGGCAIMGPWSMH